MGRRHAPSHSRRSLSAPAGALPCFSSVEAALSAPRGGPVGWLEAPCAGGSPASSLERRGAIGQASGCSALDAPAL